MFSGYGRFCVLIEEEQLKFFVRSTRIRTKRMPYYVCEKVNENNFSHV